MRRRPSIDDDEMAEIAKDLDELKALLRKKPDRRVPAVGGGALRKSGLRHDGVRARPAAFARAIVAGLNPLVAAFQAGYLRPNRMTVWRLMRDEKVRAEIDRLRIAEKSN